MLYAVFGGLFSKKKIKLITKKNICSKSKEKLTSNLQCCITTSCRTKFIFSFAPVNSSIRITTRMHNLMENKEKFNKKEKSYFNRSMKMQNKNTFF